MNRTAYYVLCECEALAYRIQAYMGNRPKEYDKLRTKDLYKFVYDTTMQCFLKTWKKGTSKAAHITQ